MKTKFILASTLGLLGVTTLIIGGTTFANNEKGERHKVGIHTGARMGNRGSIMFKFTNSGDAQAFKAAVEAAVTSNDYIEYVAANTKYGITKYMTNAQFTKRATAQAHKKQSDDALRNGDYASWKSLNANTPLLKKIDTEAKFKKLQEMQSYKEKMSALRTEMGIGKGKGMKRGNGIWKQNSK